MRNNTQLIPIINRGRQEQWVDARTLHTFLNSKQEFANWIKPFVQEYGFVEGRDFLTTLSKSTGGRQAIEYSITLDMAKHLAMLQRNEKGMQARQYFIEWEKRGRHLEATLLKGYEEAQEIFDECLTIEHDGCKWYAAAQLTLLCGRMGTGCGYQARVKRMESEGKVKKILNRGRLLWFVKAECVKDLLNVKRRMIVASTVVNLLEKGGIK